MKERKEIHQLTEGTVVLEHRQNEMRLRLAKEGSGVRLPWDLVNGGRYLVFSICTEEEHCEAFHVFIYGEKKEPVMTIRFGILPQIRTTICLDREWLNAGVLFPEALPGELKIVCHGGRIVPGEVSKVELVSLLSFHDTTIVLSDITQQDDYPEAVSLSEEKLVDCFGQNKKKNWNGKIRQEEELIRVLKGQSADENRRYPFADWTAYGGWKQKKLGDGTGFFTKYKADGRWWLADPDGYAFFSVGPDCVGVPVDCRVDGVETWLDWLPDEEDVRYKAMFSGHRKESGKRRSAQLFSYAAANLYRAFGEEWYEAWKRMMTGQLMQMGMNTLGNWSDNRLFDHAAIPYVTSLPQFPETQVKIFRDFPDVFSQEYQDNAVCCAKALEARKDDPMMIGYFLRNEPSWAFVDNLVLADEVLYNPEPTVCRERLIAFLKDRYHTIEALNQAWNQSFEDFDALRSPMRNASGFSPAARRDLREFSAQMLQAYVEIPAKACRAADPNHMILGMRWAWISDPDLVTGWENFDVFSINCYAVDPTSAIDHIAELGVDLPVMIGEFHFGALDAGLGATGLEGVLTQEDRGKAYRYYCERAAAQPYGVGCHYFQCYDQFFLGRFDGENYNIGLFDICSRPYEAMKQAIYSCSQELYPVAAGEKAPTEEKGRSIPMIAY